MATKYFRITGYSEQDNMCFIIDSNGMFEQLWQFSSYLVKRGLKVLEVGDEEKFLDINISKAEQNNKQMLLRATGRGKPIYSDKTINGIVQRTLTVGEKSYIPNITK